MPRQKLNTHPEGSAEWADREMELVAIREERAANPLPPQTERRLTITVSIEAIQAAKSLATLSGSTYREVLALAATHGVDSLTAKVRTALLGPTSDPDTGIPY